MTVLGRAAILERFDELFPARDADPQNVMAAKYYLTLGQSYLILPDGTRFGRDGKRVKAMVIKPGETAYVSSAEHLVMPPDLVGLIGPRFSSAEQGVLFFGGMLVDPGYGMKGDPLGQPLSFNIANVGQSPLVIRPGEDIIASLAFMKVKKARSQVQADPSADKPIQLREELFSAKRSKPSGALGLVEDLSDVREQVDRLQTSLKTVVLFGVILLAATLFAAIIAAILSFSNESGSAQISSESWQNIGWALGSAIGGTVLLVAAFYLMVRAGSILMGIMRRQRLDAD